MTHYHQKNQFAFSLLSVRASYVWKEFQHNQKKRDPDNKKLEALLESDHVTVL